MPADFYKFREMMKRECPDVASSDVLRLYNAAKEFEERIGMVLDDVSPEKRTRILAALGIVEKKTDSLDFLLKTIKKKDVLMRRLRDELRELRKSIRNEN